MISDISAARIIERLMQVLDCTSDDELAVALNIGKTTVASWRHRNKIPFNECVEIAKLKNVTLDWLITGVGQRHRSVDFIRETAGEYSPNTREQSLRELKLIQDWVEAHAAKQGRKLKPRQVRAFVDFAFLYKLDEVGVERVLTLLDYCE